MTLTVLPSKGRAFLGSSSEYLVFVAESLSTKLWPFFKIVPMNASASGLACVCIVGVAGSIDWSGAAVMVNIVTKPASEKKILMIHHILYAVAFQDSNRHA